MKVVNNDTSIISLPYLTHFAPCRVYHSEENLNWQF